MRCNSKARCGNGSGGRTRLDQDAKVSHGFCGHGNSLFNLDPHVVAVAKKMLSHLLNRQGWVPQHGLFSEQAIRRTSGSLLWP
jgi:hypothetical protein